ncbi:LOW QUALITY PROTEIN: citramalyl-CoA lyase, mitochondrial-like [Hydractinia symbiolongicarpus]|uniref:LOW QUALITY PROTEIN: citramalyl-CoA lyase, mitochondrial-like n=1 Tax=Hydractinia symbiolongicarpus TaxID=13093 RepID=UPI00254A7B34|nr:LOW QUALITY PROTEIN: citramalyl-CoA lyase, mitochondrial-like [Hydractinia symbiolongicarpus]
MITKFRTIIAGGKIADKLAFRKLSKSSGFRPRRSVLYVPGNDTKKIEKASGLPADVVVLDCEDGVALNMKDVCRQTIQEVLPSLSFGRSESTVRINSIDSSFALDDLESVLCGATLPQALMVPKIESVEQIKWLKHESKKHLGEGSNGGPIIKVIGQSETPKGLLDLRVILEEACKEDANLKFECFVFGSDDFSKHIGGTRTKDAKELLFARQYFVMLVKGFGLQAIDMVDIDFKDLRGLQQQSEEGAKMGFTGKQVIHPAQIDIVNDNFSPSQEKIDYSRELVEEFEQHQKTGKGAFSFRGTMIDMPSVKQAINVLNLADVISKT